MIHLSALNIPEEHFCVCTIKRHPDGILYGNNPKRCARKCSKKKCTTFRFLNYVIPTWVLRTSTASFKFVTIKCCGNPSTSFPGIGCSFLHIGHVKTLLSSLHAVAHSFKHLQQNTCRHGKPFGSSKGLKQIPHSRKFLFISDVKEVVPAAILYAL